jgi:malonyl CoA-acyl carrier protein transacylase
MNALLFAGQGSQYVGMMRGLTTTYTQAAEKTPIGRRDPWLLTERNLL